ncbi:MAG: hypothetical protein U0528_00020 [Anaerolineae bacterium]
MSVHSMVTVSSCWNVSGVPTNIASGYLVLRGAVAANYAARLLSRQGCRGAPSAEAEVVRRKQSKRMSIPNPPPPDPARRLSIPLS